MSIKKDIVWRVGLVYIGLFVFAVLIASKLVFLQVIGGEKWKKMAEETRIKNFRIPSHRGDILTDDMRLLASDVPYYEVRMDMKAPGLTDAVFRKNIDSLSLKLAQLFNDKSKYQYKTELTNARRRKERYYAVKTKVDYLQLKELKTFPIFRRGRFKGGVMYEPRTIRVKPNNELAKRTIGYITQSKTDGDVGLEGAYNFFLQGKEGFQKRQKISGSWMPIGDENEVDPEDGSSIVTTIDIDLQDVAHRALHTQLKNHDAQYGSVVLMEVGTGDIKSIVNLSKKGGIYREVYNYAVGASTEPGSTFKLPALLTALEDGVVGLNDTIDTGKGRYKPYKNDNFEIKDDSWITGGYGKLSVQQIFEKSSNVGMAKIIEGAYKKKPHLFVDRLYKMSLNQRLNLEIPGEGYPKINYPGDKLWSGVSLAQMAYGYEVRLTPMQLLTLYNAVANNGKMVKPRFVKEIRNHGKIIKTYPIEIINASICSKSTIQKAHKTLEGVVERGTATNLQASHFKIAGKTGTTQIYNQVGGYKGRRSYQASFAGYFPASNPKYSCIVVISAPSRNVYYGNQVAGPVFLEIANKVYATSLSLQKPLNANKSKSLDLPYSKNGYTKETIAALKKLGIKTMVTKDLGEWSATQKKEAFIRLENKKAVDNLMPNLNLMGLKDAIYLLENMGLVVEVKGRGSIRKQSVPPGARVRPGQRVTIEMSFIEG